MSGDGGKNRKRFWTFVLSAGCIYSSYMIGKNAHRYFDHPSIIKPIFRQDDHVSFPKVTICMNGMHSRSKIEQYYPGMKENLLRQMYTGTFKSKSISKNPEIAEQLKSKSYDEFVKQTSMGIRILGCRYMGRKCTRYWEEKYTRYGMCYSFNPDGGSDTPEKKIAIGRKAALSLVVGFNQSDASIGWFHFLSGMTLYYSDRNENTLDPLYSLSLPPGSVPMISIISTNTQKLGPPYSKCMKHNQLSHYANYTQDQCIFECLSLVIHATCGCVTGYMANYNSDYTPCSLYDHADCVAPLMTHFNHTACSCLPACSEKIPQGQLIQYGNYKDAAVIIKQAGDVVHNMSAVVVYLAEVNEVTHLEVAQYTMEQFLSDVGGPAGLFMGMSLAMVLGIFR